MPDLTIYEVFACPKGGELLDTLGDPQLSPERFSYQFDATNCAIGAIVFTGFTQGDGPAGFESEGVVHSGSINAIDIELDDARDLSTISFGQAFYFPDETNLRF